MRALIFTFTATALLIAMCCSQLFAQTPPARKDDSYHTLQLLSGYTLNTSGHIPEDSIIRLSQRVEELARIAGEIPHEFKAGQIQANTYGLQGNLGLAASKSQQLLEKAQRTNDPLAIGLAMQALGDTYMYSDRYELADSVFTEAWTLIADSSDSFLQLQLLLQHLHIYINLADTTQAESTIGLVREMLDDKRLRIPGEEHYHLTVAGYEMLQAMQKQDSARAQRALKVIQHSVPQKETTDIWVQNIISQYHQFIGEYNKAVAYNDSALVAARIAPNRNILSHTLKYRAALLEAMGRTEESSKTLAQLISLTDSLYKTQYTTQVDSLHIAYMVDRLQISNITRRNALYTKAIFGLIGGLCIMIAAVVVIRRANRRLVESRRQLEATREATADSIRSKSLFLSNMSHELRTPLNAIMGFSMILTQDEECDEETRRQCSDYIHQNADLLMKLIGDVVDVSNLQGDTIRFTLAPCDIVPLCRNVLDTVNNVKRTQAQLFFETELTGLILDTDSNRLQQVLINLLINATKFTTEGRISLRLHIDPAHNEAVLAVEDTGCGIPEHRQQRIFERFEKLHEGKQGAGLGLSICKLIVEHLGGRIWIDPTYTNGTRFVFTHPLNQPTKTDRT